MDDVVMGGAPPGAGPGPGPSAGAGPNPNTGRKRNRIRFSCNNCRDKKLKCNRVLPCDQCLKRSLGGVCRYMPYTSYGEDQGHSRQPSLKRQHSAMDPPFDLEHAYETGSAYAESGGTAGTGSSRSGSVLGDTAPMPTPTPTQPMYHPQFQEFQYQQHQQHHHHHHHQPIPRSHPQQQPPQTQQPTPQPQHPRQHRPQTQPQYPFPPPPPILHDASSQSVPERLKYLEQLVMFLTARPKEQRSSPGSQATDEDDMDDDGDGEYEDDMSSADSESSRHSILGPGGEIVNANPNMNIAEFRYADPSNWEGVLDDIVGLTRDLVLVDDAVLGVGLGLGTGMLPGGWDFGQAGAGVSSGATSVSAASGANTLALFVGYNGLSPAATDMLRYLPPRPVVDLLVARFFKSLRENADPHALHLLFHPASFERQYSVFWSDPKSASLSYLSLLFLIVAHAAIASLRDNDERTSPARAALGDDPLTVVDACRHRAAQCLTLDDYARPGRYKIEALILYFGVEYYWRRRLQTTPSGSHASPLASTAMILSLAVRLAMNMGYHRDPYHFGGRLSPFEGEMRRRVWLVLVNLDQTVCYELSLPSNVHHGSSARPTSGDSDTSHPRNLYDSDLSEDLPTLPPARPSSERTGVLYAVARSRLLAVLADIVRLRPMSTVTAPTHTAAETTENSPDAAGGSAPLPTPPTQGNTPNTLANSNTSAYEARVMQLDRRLAAAYNALPSCLRLRGKSATGHHAFGSEAESSAGSGGSRSGESIMSGEAGRQRAAAAAAVERDPLDPRDPPDLCVERYLLEILYQKARLVLHRRFQGTERASPRYAYARWVCTDAAVRLLRHQYDIYVAVQPDQSQTSTLTSPTDDRSDTASDRYASTRRGSIASSAGKKSSSSRKDAIGKKPAKDAAGGGRLAAYHWLMSDSAMTHDFLLADTVLCLEVSYVTRRPTGVNGELSIPAGGNGDPDNGAVVSLPQLLGLLRTSRSIWSSLQGTSTEASRAYSVLTRVLADAEAMEEESEEEEASTKQEDQPFEPASPAFTTSTARTARTARTGYSNMSARTVSTTATTVSMQSSSHSSMSLTATAAAPTRPEPVPAPMAPTTTERERAESESTGTSGSTTPRYGEFKPPDPVQQQEQQQQTQQPQQSVSTPMAPLPPPVVQVPHAPHTPQGMALPQLSPTSNQQWSAQTPLLPVLLDTGMPTPVVGYGLPMQQMSGLTGLPSGLPSGLMPNMAVPLQFPQSSTQNSSSGLPTPLDGDDGMQGLVDATFAGDWNALWPDSAGGGGGTGSPDNNRSSPNWNDFFSRGGMQ